jgi:hypothetical protein
MKSYKQAFDLFVAGGTQHVSLLNTLLPKLQPYGTVHLASSFLTGADLAQLRGLYDVLHTPRHSEDGYFNFELFTIRDINTIASAPYFVKLDADTQLEPDWFEYVEECLAAQPDAVLFGPRQGNVDITFNISGGLVREVLGQEIFVNEAKKVIGGFYVGKTSFFKDHKRFMDSVHELMWCYKGGRRYRPGLNPDYWPDDQRARHEPVTVIGQSKNFAGNEDTLRSLVVHAVGAGAQLHIFDSQGRIRIDRPGTMMG